MRNPFLQLTGSFVLKETWFIPSFELITKTCRCNIQRFLCRKNQVENFIENVLIFFLIFAPNIDCGYTLEPPRRGGSNEYPQSMF